MTQTIPEVSQKPCQHGPAIRALRRKEGFHTHEFADLVGVSASHLRNIENEQRVAGLENLNRIARILGVPIAAVSRQPLRAPTST